MVYQSIRLSTKYISSEELTGLKYAVLTSPEASSNFYF